MDNRRVSIALATTTVLGAGTALYVPNDWLSYFFWGAGLAALIFGALAGASAQEGKHGPETGAATRLVLWFAISTDRPMAKVMDMEALVFFFGSLAYLAGLTIGTFSAVLV
jgi:hypothetical protein